MRIGSTEPELVSHSMMDALRRFAGKLRLPLTKKIRARVAKSKADMVRKYTDSKGKKPSVLWLYLISSFPGPTDCSVANPETNLGSCWNVGAFLGGVVESS